MKKIILCIFSIAATSFAHAETFNEPPNSWILESYDSTGVVFNQTPATCLNGRIILPGTSSIADRNRLFSIVMAAKMSGGKISITYAVSGNSCIVTKFSTIAP